MGILDQLIEKKDLRLYIKGRKAEIRKSWEIALKNTPDEQKEHINQRFKGRIAELNTLYSVVNNNALREESIRYWYLIEGSEE